MRRARNTLANTIHVRNDTVPSQPGPVRSRSVFIKESGLWGSLDAAPAKSAELDLQAENGRPDAEDEEAAAEDWGEATPLAKEVTLAGHGNERPCIALRPLDRQPAVKQLSKVAGVARLGR